MVGVRGNNPAFMITLLGLCGCAHAANEPGHEVGELLLVAWGKLMKARRGNWRHRVLWDGWLTLFARHGFPPWPGPESLHQVC